MDSKGSDKPQETETRSESAVEDKPPKRTSRLAVASAFFVLLASFCLALTCGFGSHNVIMPSIAFLLSIVALVVGVAAVLAIAVNRKGLGGLAYGIPAIIAAGFFLVVVPISIVKTIECSRAVVCMSNLHGLGLAIKMYAEAHDGYLPSADKWCDLLAHHDESSSKELFRCPAAKGDTCNYAFNTNLDGRRLGDVNKPAEVVLLFESEAGCNLSGGEESVKMRHEGSMGQFCNAAFCDFSVRSFHEDKQAARPLRWKP